MRTFFAFIVLPLLVLVMLALGFVWIANWRDEPLRDEIRALIEYKEPSPDALRNNGLLIIAGLDAPLSGDASTVADAFALGQQRLRRETERMRWYQQHGLAADDTQAPAVFNPGSPMLPKAVFPDALQCKDAAATNCHEWYLQHAADIRPLYQRQQALLKRLDAAGLALEFSNPFPTYLMYQLMPYQLLMRAHELQLARASLLWSEGRHAQALDLAEAADHLTRRLGNSSNQLIGTMIAVAMQYRTLRWLSSAVAAQDSMPSPVLLRVTQLLNQPIVSVRDGLEGEMRFTASVHRALGENARKAASDISQTSLLPLVLNKLMLRVTYLPNESLNQHFQWWEMLMPVADTPAHKLEAALKQTEQHWQDWKQQRRRWLGARNYTGNILMNMAHPSYTTYLYRAHDVDGYRRMALLHLQAQTNQVPAAQMPQWLHTSPKELRNPYTLEPMQWDAATRSLVFEGRESQSQNPDSSKTYRVRY